MKLAQIALPFRLYIAAWSTVCVVALFVALRRGRDFAIASGDYRRFLAEPWKLITFVTGTALITLVARYTGDPTWDWFDGLFMSILCFTTAPWVVGTLFRAMRRRARADEVVVAIVAWLFSASWSYNLYLTLRDGIYPLTWASNLFASSVIYLCAGFFWNLEHVPGRGVIFSFMRADWPLRATESSPWRLAIYALIFAAPAIAAVLAYLL